jgi:hypothetical protein
MEPFVCSKVTTGDVFASDERSWLKEFEDAVIDHAAAYVNGRIHTNGVENYWSRFKRGSNATWAFQPFYLFRYFDEQGFRFNNRKMDVGIAWRPPRPTPHVPGNTETERMDNALHMIFSVSKDELRKQAQARKKRAKTKKSIPP